MQTSDNSAFVEHICLLGQLHEKIRCGQGDSAEADAIRDLMEQSWRCLSPHVQMIVRGMSTDINNLRLQSR